MSTSSIRRSRGPSSSKGKGKAPQTKSTQKQSVMKRLQSELMSFTTAPPPVCYSYLSLSSFPFSFFSPSPILFTHPFRRISPPLLFPFLSFLQGISAFPSDDSILQWSAQVTGVKGTAYEELTYQLSIEFSSSYPLTSPTVKFVTPIFHPNVDSHGNICLDILKEEWSACYNVSTILLSIQSLLGEPNPDSPLNAIAADLSRRSAAGLNFFFSSSLLFLYCYYFLLSTFSSLSHSPSLEYKEVVVSKYKEFQSASKCK